MNIRLNVYTDKWDCCDCAYTLMCTLMASDVWLSGSSHISYWNLFHFHYHAQYPRALKGVRWNRDPRPKPGTQWDPRLPTFLCRVPGLGLGSWVSGLDFTSTRWKQRDGKDERASAKRARRAFHILKNWKNNLKKVYLTTYKIPNILKTSLNCFYMTSVIYAFNWNLKINIKGGFQIIIF